MYGLSWRFYEAQMSGRVPLWSRAHKANGGWRSDSHLQDGMGPDGVGRDLSGGWYDAGDHLKLHLPLGVSSSLLGYGALAWERTLRDAGQWDVAVRNLDWVAQYWVKCHISASGTPADNILVGQIGDPHTDHDLYWGRPEQQPQGGSRGQTDWRPVWVVSSVSPGADIPAEVAASLMAFALMLRRPGAYQDAARADSLAARARQLYAFAKTSSRSWPTPPGTEEVYKSTTYLDDLAWAAAWMCAGDVAAGQLPASSSYCSEGARLWDRAGAEEGASGSEELSWDSVYHAAGLLLLELGAGGPAYAPRFRRELESMIGKWMSPRHSCAGGGGDWGLCSTPQGFAWLSVWGSARYNAHAQLVALAYSRGTAGGGASPAAPGAAPLAAADSGSRRTMRCWAVRQASYLAGRNTARQSFVVGYAMGASYRSPQRPHHESSSCSPDYSVPCDWDAFSAPGPNPSVLAGALVGGPRRDDSYEDDRSDYVLNEVGVEYNAGWTGALAGLTAMDSALARTGCSWEGYCAGRCEPQEEEGGSGAGNAGGGGGEDVGAAPLPPPRPSPPPPPSPLLSPSPPPRSRPRPPSPLPSSSPMKKRKPPPPSPSGDSGSGSGGSGGGDAGSVSYYCRNSPAAPGYCSPSDQACQDCARHSNAALCRACVAALQRAGQDPYTCAGCYDYGARDCTMQGICLLECTPQSVGAGRAWSCGQYCTSPDLVGTDAALARACVACVGSTDQPWNCANCIQVTQGLVDASAARATCFDCVRRGLDAWSCGQCAKKPASRRAGCMTCLLQGRSNCV